MLTNKQTQPEKVKTDLVEMPAEQEALPQNQCNKIRKPAPSKREIMEAMSRARFPWEE